MSMDDFWEYRNTLNSLAVSYRHVLLTLLILLDINLLLLSSTKLIKHNLWQCCQK